MTVDRTKFNEIQEIPKGGLLNIQRANGGVLSFDDVEYTPGGGVGSFSVARLTVTDAQIKALLGTPLMLATATPGTAIMPIACWAICDFRNGAYTDPDDPGNAGEADIIIPGDPNNVFGAIGIADADISNSPGAALFYQRYRMTLAGAGSEFSMLAPPTTLQILKNPTTSVAEFAGGGSGNSLKITLWYLEAPI